MRVAWALFTQGVAQATQYRAEIVLWMLAGWMPLFMMLIWMGLADAGPMAGFTKARFAAYFLGIYLVHEITQVWVIGELDEQIRHGRLSVALLKPLDPSWAHVADHLGALSVRLPLVVPAVVLGWWATGALTQLVPGRIGLFVLSTALAWLVVFHLHYCLGSLAFFTQQASAFEGLVYSLTTLLGGAVAPLALFPDELARWVWLTPFPSILSTPVEILLGDLTSDELPVALGVQALWAVGLVLASRALWWAGRTRYQAYGS
ncbi:MAG: ABC-2 family transporter protein [Myxococcales bacterium]|nr:ABC-2 family transporter protein [Myxococcales bacterium]